MQQNNTVPFLMRCTWDVRKHIDFFFYLCFTQNHLFPFTRIALTLCLLFSRNSKPPEAESDERRPLWPCWRSHSFALDGQLNTVPWFQARNSQQENKSSVSPEHWLTENANSQRSAGSHSTPTLTLYWLLCKTELETRKETWNEEWKTYFISQMQ